MVLFVRVFLTPSAMKRTVSTANAASAPYSAICHHVSTWLTSVVALSPFIALLCARLYSQYLILYFIISWNCVSFSIASFDAAMVPICDVSYADDVKQFPPPAIVTSRQFI